jgi:Tfp pilus assembly protein PilV
MSKLQNARPVAGSDRSDRSDPFDSSYSSDLTFHVSRSTFHAPRWHAPRPGPLRAFTLVEVMIASGIFFMATFAILALVAGTLKNARNLQRADVDAGMAASLVYDIVKTNKNDNGGGTGDFGEAYPEYSYDFEWHPSDLGPMSATAPGASASPQQAPSLAEVDVTLNRRGNHKPVDYLVFLVYQPNAQPGHH